MRNQRDLKKIYNSNYYQNTLPINLDGDKNRTRECFTFFIRSELKFNPHEKTACVFTTWTILQMDIVSEGVEGYISIGSAGWGNKIPPSPIPTYFFKVTDHFHW